MAEPIAIMMRSMNIGVGQPETGPHNIATAATEAEEEDTRPFLETYQNGQPSRARSASVDHNSQPDSHQYECEESDVWRAHQKTRLDEDRGHWWTLNKKRAAKRWVLTFVISVLTGWTAVCVTYFTQTLTRLKFQTVYELLEQEKNHQATTGSAFFAFWVFNLVYVSIAWSMVCIESLSAGSGIPEVKCFLNGLNIPRVVRVRTFMCKVFGITFSVSGGLPAGKEGPMVHSGAVLAAGVSQGKSNTFGFDTSFARFQDFRNDREKRDFVACGAAAGVAAAFGAPVGGVLFSLEEGASFWSTKLTWRCFFCAMMTVATVYVIRTAQEFWGQADSTAMFSFGKFYSLNGVIANYSMWELVLFVLIGCMGGLIGAVFNACNFKLTMWRKVKRTKPHLKFLEVLCVASLMSFIAFILPLLWGTCTPKPVDRENWSDQEKILVDKLVPLYCNGDTDYNEVASLYFTDSDTAIKQLFHYRESGDMGTSTFSSSALFLFFAPYLTMACITYGLSVPSGLFVPSLLSGAAFGRLIGHLLHRLDNTSGTFADSGTYALIGAAAVLGGMARMTISLTVIMLEATGDMQYVLPLMLTLMAARWVGNVFGEGLYDLHIRIKEFAFLDESAPMVLKQSDLTVEDVMSKNPHCLPPVVRVGEVYDLLKRVQHHCFPVVSSTEGDVLVGSIARKVITTLIQHRAFGPPSTNPYSSRRVSPLLDWHTLECMYPRYPLIKNLTVTSTERASWLDLRPYMDTSPHVIQSSASVQRTYRLFRTMGLRHLIVVNIHNHVLGMVTRHDLAEVTVEHKFPLTNRRNAYS